MLNPFANDFKPIPLPSPPNQTIVDKPKKKAVAKKATPKKIEPKKAEAKKAGPQNAEPKRADKKEEKKKKLPRKNTEVSNGKKKDSQAHSNEGTLGDAAALVELPFIAIEAAIDPIHRLDKSMKRIFEHGYERYIDWIDRSLNRYDTVTLVGMENAIVDIVSLVTILQDRKIAAHDDVETFTMNPGTDLITNFGLFNQKDLE